ncbi:SIR2 family NAD-dependent protein deacylase [Robertkochia aurantiaca]|uniref:SIR2 family NAD-dependent protein deacylase n=1 Tax=Robertkochia aurantiaca TaxID=2873700 RepID=UPI001CCD630D|nr:NAD-dependent deacylase [Robertkochia sp. 3YJGBD-33]
MRKVIVLSGAGVSAESGLKTFRDAGGLWEGYDVMEVASPQGWDNNMELVLDFYNQRRRQLLKAKPNRAHLALAKLEKHRDVTIITQNIDDLHERAGSSEVIHLHGELLKARSTFDHDLVYDWRGDLNPGDLCEHNHQLRPHVVWFGEAVPMMETAIEKVQKADDIIIVGTSMQVYPAAGLVNYRQPGTPVYFIDPNPSLRESHLPNLNIIRQSATIGVPIAVERLIRS